MGTCAREAPERCHSAGCQPARDSIRPAMEPPERRLQARLPAPQSSSTAPADVTVFYGHRHVGISASCSISRPDVFAFSARRAGTSEAAREGPDHSPPQPHRLVEGFKVSAILTLPWLADPPRGVPILFGSQRVAGIRAVSSQLFAAARLPIDSQFRGMLRRRDRRRSSDSGRRIDS